MVIRVMKCTNISDNPVWTTYHAELLYVLSHLILLGKWLYLHSINEKTKGKREFKSFAHSLTMRNPSVSIL